MLVKEEGLEGEESRVVKNGRQKEFLEHGGGLLGKRLDGESRAVKAKQGKE